MEQTNSPTATGGQDNAVPAMPNELVAGDASPAPGTGAVPGTPPEHSDMQARDRPTVHEAPQMPGQDMPVGAPPAAALTSLQQPIPSIGPVWPAPDPVPFAEPWIADDPAATSPRFTLHRSKTDRMLGGVCGGLAESLDVDTALLRIGLVVLTILGFGLGAVVYLAAWILAPQAD
ncbi:MAG: PspC domain-containing protein [Pseudonocardia sp.]